MKKQQIIIIGNSSDVIASSISSPERLLCEYLENPLGIATAVPRLSWELKPLQRGASQSAWRIMAASTRDAVMSGSVDLWDSGRTESSQNIHIEYAGKALTSGQTVWWRVMAWDAEGIATAWSDPASFEIGLLDDSDWHGEWIAAPENISSPLMRREFTLADKKVKRARIYVSGLGYSELYVNGKRSGDRVLDPAWTDYDRREMRDLYYPYVDRGAKRVYYAIHDVTPLIMVSGCNAIGVMLGNGMHNQRSRTAEGKMWYGRPRMLLEMRIEYADGTRDIVASDSKWMCGEGPIRSNDVFVGEVYDARFEKDGWASPQYAQSSWGKVESASRPTGKLISFMANSSSEPAEMRCSSGSDS